MTDADLQRVVEQLADRHPPGDLVDDRPELGQEVFEVGLVPVVGVLLAVPGAEPGQPRRWRDARRVRRQVRVLEQRVEHVQPEAVDAASQPAADHLELGGPDGRVAPVQLGLLAQERVHVELLARGLPLPGAAAEDRRPVVRRDRLAAAPAGGIAPQIPVGMLAVPAPARVHEPRMEVARVVEDEVEDHPEPALVRGRDQPVEVVERPEHRIDRRVVGDVVADVEPRRRVDRRQPERIDPERLEMVEMGEDARQVADPVTVAVGEAPRVDLVDDPALPPVGRSDGHALPASTTARSRRGGR